MGSCGAADVNISPGWPTRPMSSRNSYSRSPIYLARQGERWGGAAERRCGGARERRCGGARKVMG
jgi:hypothetical protein